MSESVNKNNERNDEIRVRFAPSPTGFLHIGSARTALFNYLFAKKNNGKFILRIEDTDIERSKKEFEIDILENLKWLGINWDEGPLLKEINNQNFLHAAQTKPEKDEKGNYGPYRQSQRKEIYKKYIQKLLDEKRAYYCFCEKEELEAKRQDQISRGLPPRYDGKCSKLSEEEISRLIKNGQPSVIRFKIPPEKVSFVDLVRGNVEFDASLFGDIVIAKDLETPLYNFASVVDDFEMKITHVIRGEDHISNTPKQILIQQALGFNSPFYAHLPLILGPDKSKLSKRHGAMAVSEYKTQGYLPESIINFLAFLGWNPGTEKEIYQLSSLIKEFSIKKIQKSGAIFNIEKLNYLNGFYIRQKSIKELTSLCIPYLIEKNLIKPIIEEGQYPPAYGGKNIFQYFEIFSTKEKISFNFLEKAISLYQERLKKLSEITELIDFFFKKELSYPIDLLFWKDETKTELKIAFQILIKELSEIEEEKWNEENIKNKLLPLRIKRNNEEIKDRGYILWPLRVALTGKKTSAGPFEIAEVLGKKKTLLRIKKAIDLIK